MGGDFAGYRVNVSIIAHPEPWAEPADNDDRLACSGGLLTRRKGCQSGSTACGVQRRAGTKPAREWQLSSPSNRFTTGPCAFGHGLLS